MNPEHFFPGKEDDEKILCWAHRHWLFLLSDILIGIVLVLVPIGLLLAANGAGADLSTYPTRPIIAAAGSIYYLSLATWFFIRWIDYYLDLAIVTDQRVVDIDQFGLFRRNVAELKHNVVQDVTTNKTGILQTFFDFGDVVIQTAGEQENFTFRTVPHPDDIARKIMAVGHDHDAEEKEASEAVVQAAEQMKEAAEKIEETVEEEHQSKDAVPPAAESPKPATNESPAPQPSQPETPPPAPTSEPAQTPESQPDQRPTDGSSDLPREYER